MVRGLQPSRPDIYEEFVKLLVEKASMSRQRQTSDPAMERAYGHLGATYGAWLLLVD